MSGASAAPVALITGGAQGIGRAFARRFSTAGHSVVVADLQEAAAIDVAAALEGPGLGVGVDVADAESVAAGVSLALERFGRIDVLVNNAAIFSSIKMQPFDQISPSEWRQVVDVNLTGAFLCCREVAGAMRAQGRGAIVNISSSAVLLGRPFYAHYVSSKAGIVGLTRALAQELGPDGITVNTIMPGSTETEVNRETVSAEQVRDLVARQSVKRRLRVDDIAGTALFLASDQAGVITGQTLVVDGGLSFI